MHQFVKNGLSRLGRTADGSGTAIIKGYAFVNLDVEGKDIKSLHDVLASYPHLRYINVSKNQLSELQSVNAIANLLVLNAAKNQISSLSN